MLSTTSIYPCISALSLDTILSLSILPMWVCVINSMEIHRKQDWDGTHASRQRMCSKPQRGMKLIMYIRAHRQHHTSPTEIVYTWVWVMCITTVLYVSWIITREHLDCLPKLHENGHHGLCDNIGLVWCCLCARIGFIHLWGLLHIICLLACVPSQSCLLLCHPYIPLWNSRFTCLFSFLALLWYCL